MLSYGGNARFHLSASAIAQYKEAFNTERALFSKHYRSLVRQATSAAVALAAEHQQEKDHAQEQEQEHVVGRVGNASKPQEAFGRRKRKRARGVPG